MVGKGKRRREKNYEAAHGGGHTRLPPPPDPSAFDAMPSKLRKLMSFSGGAAARKSVTSTERSMGNGVGNVKGKMDTTSSGAKRKRNDQIEMKENTEHGGTNEKKKRKNKRKKAEDLRFQTADELRPAGTRRKEHRKQRLEAKKKKNKNAKSDDEKDFHGHENIKFGEVVQAPPKLNSVPKAFKTIQDASQERLRLQAVESYRKRKGWMARPGVQLPPPVTTSPFA